MAVHGDVLFNLVAGRQEEAAAVDAHEHDAMVGGSRHAGLEVLHEAELLAHGHKVGFVAIPEHEAGAFPILLCHLPRRL
eukprot:jgi/Chrpa1/7062/Chrysochromulina_OHIO_Genome00013128-RA